MLFSLCNNISCCRVNNPVGANIIAQFNKSRNSREKHPTDPNLAKLFNFNGSNYLYGNITGSPSSQTISDVTYNEVITNSYYFK